MYAKNTTILAIDQGTTSTRAVLFNNQGKILFQKSIEISQTYPKKSWVEQDPEEIWKSVLLVTKQMISFSLKEDMTIKAIGITNQRETTILWDKKTGIPIYNAIVWQDRRTEAKCKLLRKRGFEKEINKKTGLLLDPYFSSSKIAWILDNVNGAREKAKKDELCFGTIDTFVLWRLTGGKQHSTDVTNASRTSLYNILKLEWDKNLCKIFNIPFNILPLVHDCVSDFGLTQKNIVGLEIPIKGIVGDQQAAAIGQGCINEGDLKSTFGTGCFMLVNTGKKLLYSKNKLLSTIAYRIDGKVSYALEGSIFISGAIVKWLRDRLKLISNASETEEIAKKLRSNQGVYIVPALVGLGAPHWIPEARGSIYGLTLESGSEVIVRASLESVVYQTFDLIEAFKADGITINRIRVDGGMTVNSWLMQFLSDILNITVEKPIAHETTAIGTAILALIGSGYFKNIKEAQKIWLLERKFLPALEKNKRKNLIKGWLSALRRTKMSM